MTVHEAIQKIKQTPVEARIEIIEQLLQSLKQDVVEQKSAENIPFTVRTFDLGQEIIVDREELYMGRGL